MEPERVLAIEDSAGRERSDGNVKGVVSFESLRSFERRESVVAD